MRDEPCIVDLATPPAGAVDRAAFGVTLTRFGEFTDFALLRPLYTPSTRQAKINSLTKNLAIPQDLEEEMERYQDLHNKTILRYPEHFFFFFF